MKNLWTLKTSKTQPVQNTQTGQALKRLTSPTKQPSTTITCKTKMQIKLSFLKELFTMLKTTFLIIQVVEILSKLYWERTLMPISKKESIPRKLRSSSTHSLWLEVFLSRILDTAKNLLLRNLCRLCKVLMLTSNLVDLREKL